MAYSAVSLFSGAGGMDVGFEDAGFDIVWANELSPAAAMTYAANHEAHIEVGDLDEKLHLLVGRRADVVFGGPPCQGYSVAGKMNPNDPRSHLIFSFLEAVDILRPSAFVMENVKALGTSKRWQGTREDYLERAASIGYECHPFVCRATDYGVPQKRERVFFVGMPTGTGFEQAFARKLEVLKNKALTVREALAGLGAAGTDSNPLTCTAKITPCKNPVLRPSPYAGMLFNGSGRVVDIDGWCNTLVASMGGTHTPIIDEEFLNGGAQSNWIAGYHRAFLENNGENGGPCEIPKRMRRMTLKEAARIQTFPDDYKWPCSKSASYKQVGNAVPCKLAYAVASALIGMFDDIGVEAHEAEKMGS